jgi:GrpB-like predicted nucleotidyltransferase (UPF0157 family)
LGNLIRVIFHCTSSACCFLNIQSPTLMGLDSLARVEKLTRSIIPKARALLKKIIHSDCLQPCRNWFTSHRRAKQNPLSVGYNPERVIHLEFRRMDMARTIELAPYNPDWPAKYELEAQRLIPVFGEQLISIQHIGSTAIPGIKAKPVIDIMIVVQDLELVEEFNPEMIGLGYTPRGEAGIPGRRFFRKDTQEIRSHHVHVYARGHEAIQTQLNFRDFLRAHPEDAQAYSRLKEALAAAYPFDPGMYTESKTEFILEINQRAVDWRECLRKAA